jgi:hypothetical protein
MYPSDVPGCYYLLCHSLESGVNPSAIVIDLPPKFLWSDMDSSVGAWSDLLEFRDDVDLAWSRQGPVFVAGFLTRKALPSSACRGTIDDAVRAAFEGKSFTFRFENQAYSGNRAKNKGAMAAEKWPEYHVVIWAYCRSIMLGEACRPASIKMRYVRGFRQAGRDARDSCILGDVAQRPGASGETRRPES